MNSTLLILCIVLISTGFIIPMLLLQPLGKIEKMGDTQVTENNEQKIVVLGETKEGRDPDPKMRRRRDTIRRVLED